MRARVLTALLALSLSACDKSTAGAPDDLGVGGAPDGFQTTMFDLGCASSTAQAKLVPVNLIVLLDRSGSMGDGINGDPAVKWQPVTAGLEAFFADPASAGVSASLAFFPSFPSNDQCNPSVYYDANVKVTALPDTTAFKAAIDATTPAGSTPTRPAILGAIDYAKDTRDATPGSRTAIVLVTDGDPDVCDSSVANVAFEAAKIATSIPTYVIGVVGAGDDLAALDMIAQSGGTSKATLVQAGAPQQTAADFQKALEAIRGLQLTCDFPVPAPPTGMTLDFTQVNVVFTPSPGMGGGMPIELLYDADCKSGVGWRYDDPKQPTRVILCAGSCGDVQQDRGGRIDVVFGCATAGDPIL